jgi:hypothetical protein
MSAGNPGHPHRATAVPTNPTFLTALGVVVMTASGVAAP